MFEIAFGAVLVVTGLFVLIALWDLNRDKASLLMLSMGLITAGFISAFIVSEYTFFFSLMAVLFVLPTIIMILIFLSDGFKCLNNVLLALFITGLLILIVPQTYAVSVAALFFLHLILTDKTFRYHRNISMLFFVLVVLLLILLVTFPSDLFLWTLNALVFFESFFAFHAFYEERKNCMGEYGTYEVRRKLTHLLAFIIVVPLPWLDQILLAIKYVLSIINPLFTISLSTNNLINFLVIALGISAIPIFLFVEYLRISRNVMLIPSNLLREHEKTSVASYIYSISSAFVVALLFSQIVLIASVLVGLIADAMAALVGVYYGKHKITKNRTLEGTIAGFITAFVTIYIIVQHVLASLCVAFTIAIFDALNVKEINDNFIFPILSAVVLSLFL